MSRDELQLVASAPRGFADLLARELETFGARYARERSTGVAFGGDLAVAYRACLGSRIANRIFLELARFEAPDAEALYSEARRIAWAEHIEPSGTLACDFTGRHPGITNTQFGAVKLKDAIVDTLRAQSGQRPSVNVERPDVRVHAHAQGTTVTISIDLSGESLHRRGYRDEAGEAPLKENLAAGILVRAGWPALAASGAEFLDPLCGSGTFVIEAALMAAGIVPGLRRDYFGFLRWRGHDAQLWNRILEEARAHAQVAADASGATLPTIRGRDRDAAVIRVAEANARRAGVDRMVRFEVGDVSGAAPAGTAAAARTAGAVSTDGLAAAEAPPAAPSAGLLCTNPPYGVRLEDREAARAVHRELGRVLRERFAGWQAAILAGAPELGLELEIRAYRTHTVWNGPLECRLLRLRIDAASFRGAGSRIRAAAADPALRESAGARMFANRLTKNLKRLRPWAQRDQVSCYRLYDADMPEYAFAIDRYQSADSDECWLYVQEYAAPSSIDEESVRRRRSEAVSVLPEVTGVPAENIHLRTRRRVSRGEQYRKRDDSGSFHVVAEGGLRFEVNFDDYLDTGLFLDHRITRARLREAASGKRFLNLFAYTGTATVYAAAGGGRSTVSVDLSRTYTEWARRNLALNGLAARHHEYVQADCREWLQEARRRRDRFDLIFLDPPTFSNSKRMEGVLDIQRDHAALIDACMALLAPAGLLVFSTNAQRFKADESLTQRYDVRDISRETLPFDFERNPRIHRCFEIRSR